MRVIFMGTPEEVISPLKRLIELSDKKVIDLVAIVTQAAKPAGRKRVLTDPPVAKFGKDQKLKVLQPEKVSSRESLDELKSLKPDLVVTAAYGQILSQDFLDMPKRGTINIHPSMLPKYRGATPVQSTLFHGDTETGVSILFTVKALDAGNIILQKPFPLNGDELGQDLLFSCFEASADMLEECLTLLADSDFSGTPQDSTQITHCTKFKKDDGLVDWTQPTRDIYNRFRAFYPWPGTYTFFESKRIVIDSAFVVKEAEHGSFDRSMSSGQFCFSKKLKAMVVATADGYLGIKTLKPEGTKSMEAAAFINKLKSQGKDKGVFGES